MENKLSLFDNYKYNIYNESKELVYIATENGFLGLFDRFLGAIVGIGHRIFIKGLNGNELFSIKKKWGVFKRDFDICFVDNTCITVREGLALKKPEITIISPNGKYLIIGDIMARNFKIKEDEITVSNAKENISHPKSTEIFYKEEIENGTIVLYKDESGFRHTFISEKLKSSNNSGNVELNPKDGFDWTMTNNPQIPIVTFAGVITNNEITDVLVKQKTVEKKAKVIEIDKDLSIWFTYFEILESSNIGPHPLRIEALSSKEEVLWKEGVYEDGLFRGPTTEK